MFFSKSNRRHQSETQVMDNTVPMRKIKLAASTSVAILERLEDRQLMSAASLDPNFGIGGKVADDFGGFRDHANAVCVDYFGRTYVAGTSDEELFVARYTKSGQLDNSFGLGGRTFITTAGAAEAVDLKFDRGALTVVANDFAKSDVLVARLNVNGQLDKSFNYSGVEHIKFEVTFGYYDSLTTAKNSWAAGVEIQTNGKIVIGGTAQAFVGEPNYDERFALARLNPDGKMDPYFGSGGFASNEFIRNDADDHQEATCMALQADGKILVGGRDESNWGLTRFTANGKLDTSFNYGGHATPYFGSKFEYMTALDVNSAGYIVAGGFMTAGNTTVWGLAMLNPNGTMKNDFGYRGDGLLTMSTGGAYGAVASVKYQNDGRIVVLGSSHTTNGNFQLARFNFNGTFDAGFGSGGYTYVDFKNRTDNPAAMVITNYDKIVLAGDTTLGNNTDIALARIMGKTCQYSITKYSDVIVGKKVGGFLIHRDASDPFAFDSTVLHFTVTGTAKQGVDYNFGLDLPVTFQPGQSTMFVEIQTAKNYLPKTARTVDVKLNADPAYNVLAGEVVINILPK